MEGKEGRGMGRGKGKGFSTPHIATRQNLLGDQSWQNAKQETSYALFRYLPDGFLPDVTRVVEA